MLKENGKFGRAITPNLEEVGWACKFGAGVLKWIPVDEPVTFTIRLFGGLIQFPGCKTLIWLLDGVLFHISFCLDLHRMGKVRPLHEPGGPQPC